MPITQSIIERNQEINKILKESITQAFFQLLNVMDYEDITISQICKKAGVSRTGFYRNYRDKTQIIDGYTYDFFLNIQNNVMSFISGEIKDPLSFYKSYFETVKENKQIITSLRKAGFQSYHLNRANEILTSKAFDKETIIRIIMFNGALQNIALYWLFNDETTTIEQMAIWCSKYLRY